MILLLFVVIFICFSVCLSVCRLVINILRHMRTWTFKNSTASAAAAATKTKTQHQHYHHQQQQQLRRTPLNNSPSLSHGSTMKLKASWLALLKRKSKFSVFLSMPNQRPVGSTICPSLCVVYGWLFISSKLDHSLSNWRCACLQCAHTYTLQEKGSEEKQYFNAYQTHTQIHKKCF